MNNGLHGLGALRHLRPVAGEGGGDQEAYALILAQGATGSEGGAVSGGSWQTLSLTRIVQDDQELVVKLGPSGGIIVRAGRYRAFSHCTVTQVENCCSRLYDSRFGRTVGYCPSFSGTAGRLTSAILVTDDEFTVFTETEVLLQQYGASGNGAGWARGLGVGETGIPEVFGAVELWRTLDQ